MIDSNLSQFASCLEFFTLAARGPCLFRRAGRLLPTAGGAGGHAVRPASLLVDLHEFPLIRLLSRLADILDAASYFLDERAGGLGGGGRAERGGWVDGGGGRVEDLERAPGVTR